MKEIIRRRPKDGLVEHYRTTEDGKKLSGPRFGFTEGAFGDEQRQALAKEVVEQNLAAAAIQSGESVSKIQTSGSVEED